MRAAAFVWAVLGIACSHSDTVVCGDVTCPPRSSCGPNNECVPAECGDGVISGSETCDTKLMVSMSPGLGCTDLEFYQGTLGCSPVCQLDTTSCVGSCGDHEINGPESCDGIPPAGYSCADFGFDIGPLACAKSCSPGFDSCATIGWQTAAGGVPEELHAIWAAGPRTGFAVGLGGTIVRTVDGVWTPMASPTTADLFGATGFVEIVNMKPVIHAYAVGAGGVVISYDPVKDEWTKMTSGTTNALFAIAGTGPENLFAVGANDTIIHYDGTSWTPQVSGTTNKRLNGVWVGLANAFVVGEASTLLRGTNTTWTPLTVPGPSVELRAIFGVGLELFIAGDASTILHGTVASATLQPLVLPQFFQGASLLGVWGSSASDVFISGTGGTILHWNGTALRQMTSPTSRSIFGLSGIGPALVAGVTRGGTVIEYNGTSRLSETLTLNNLNTVFRLGATTIAAGVTGEVYIHDGVAWQSPLIVPSVPSVESVWATDTTIYAACGRITNPGVYRSQGGGAFAQEPNATLGANSIWGVTSPSLLVYAVGDRVQKLEAGAWTVDTTSPHDPVTTTMFGVWATDAGTWFAVGETRTSPTTAVGFTMMKTPSTAWTVTPNPAAVRLLAVWGSSATDVFAVGAKGVILHWDGTAWRSMYTGTGENLTSIHGYAHGDIYVSGTNTLLLHFDGVSWSRMTGTGFEVFDAWAERDETVFVGAAGQVQWLSRAVTTTEERCQDPWDNDGKDGTNCADDDCKNDPSCLRGGACETPVRLDCATQGYQSSTYSGVARIDDLPCLTHSTPGPEASHRFVADRSGPVTVTVSDPSGQLDLVVMPAIGGACDVTTCTAAQRSGDTLSVTFDATLNRVYHLFVDGPLYTAQPFTLDVSCP